MERRKGLRTLRALLLPAAAVAAVLCMLTAVSRLQGGESDEGRRQLEDTLRRAAVSCYAAEGIYPPTLAYLEEHYGVQVDEERYIVHYDAFAENLMPDITVTENGG